MDGSDDTVEQSILQAPESRIHGEDTEPCPSDLNDTARRGGEDDEPATNLNEGHDDGETVPTECLRRLSRESTARTVHTTPHAT